MRDQRRALSMMLVALSVVACGGAAPASGGTSQSSSAATQGTLTGSDTGCTLTGLAPSITAGYITLTAVNQTNSTFGFDMWRISEPDTYQDLVAYVEKDKQLAATGQAGLNHPAFVSDLVSAQILPSKTGELYGSVRKGTYAIVCLGPTPGGTRPIGVVGPIQVQ